MTRRIFPNVRAPDPSRGEPTTWEGWFTYVCEQYVEFERLSDRLYNVKTQPPGPGPDIEDDWHAQAQVLFELHGRRMFKRPTRTLSYTHRRRKFYTSTARANDFRYREFRVDAMERAKARAEGTPVPRSAFSRMFF